MQCLITRACDLQMNDDDDDDGCADKHTCNCSLTASVVAWLLLSALHCLLQACLGCSERGRINATARALNAFEFSSNISRMRSMRCLLMNDCIGVDILLVHTVIALHYTQPAPTRHVFICMIPQKVRLAAGCSVNDQVNDCQSRHLARTRAQLPSICISEYLRPLTGSRHRLLQAESFLNRPS